MRSPQEKYAVYILRCFDGSYYTGVTNNNDSYCKNFLNVPSS